MRIDGRSPGQLRPMRLTTGFQAYAEGSALIEAGNTKVICAVTVENRVPPFLKDERRGWITAEYSMLPRATLTRTSREGDRPSGRTHEIQRLIGRSLRAVANLDMLGERPFLVDCDVLQADGGTRTAAITGAYVALYQAMNTLVKKGHLRGVPLRSAVAATSVGVVLGEHLLDLCYEEDYQANVDFNVVMTSQGEFVEVQGTAEHGPFSRKPMDGLLVLAEMGIHDLFELQKKAIAELKAS